jgi:hypothetical protein
MFDVEKKDRVLMVVWALAQIAKTNHVIPVEVAAHELHLLRDRFGAENVKMDLLAKRPTVVTEEDLNNRLLTEYGMDATGKHPLYAQIYALNGTSLEAEMQRALDVHAKVHPALALPSAVPVQEPVQEPAPINQTLAEAIAASPTELEAPLQSPSQVAPDIALPKKK